MELELALAREWAEWCGAPERGLYVAPAPSGREWHGLQFISSGAFAGAVFAFAVSIPADYPASMPRCRFFTTVLHPEVRDQELDLSPHAADWAASRHKLILVLRKLVATFEAWNPPDPNQQRAANSCAERAVDVRHAGLPRDFAIQVSEYVDEKHGHAKREILQGQGQAAAATASGQPASASDFFQRLMFNPGGS